MHTYQETIHGLDPTINPAGVEASMRLQFGTLDHLDREDFEREISVARMCDDADPGYLRGVAASYGLLDAVEVWQARLQRAGSKR